MPEALIGMATTVLLYLMIGFPFAVWSGRGAFASANGQAGKWPSRATTLWLAVLPAIFIAIIALSGLADTVLKQSNPGDVSSVLVEEKSEWGVWLFLWCSPAMGMIVGYFAGAIAARR